MPSLNDNEYIGQVRFKIGDYVWAQPKYHPMWPAQVINPPTGVQRRQNKVWVLFFGDRTTGQVDAQTITPFDRNKLDPRKKFNGPIKAALDDILKDIDGYYE